MVHPFKQDQPESLCWETEHSEAIETLKNLLAEASALGHSNYDLPFFLFVRENKGAALGVLTQQHVVTTGQSDIRASNQIQ